MNEETKTPLNFSVDAIKEFVTYRGEKKEISVAVRREPLFGLHSMKYSDVRVNRPMRLPSSPAKRNIEEEMKTCFFEPHNINWQTPEPREYFDQLEIEGFVPVSVANLYGFSIEGRVNCFTSHYHALAENFTPQDMYNYLYISRHRAKRLQECGGNWMWNIINYGPNAGSSQPHPHSQDGIEHSSENSLNMKEFNVFQSKTRLTDDLFGNYISETRGGERFAFETKYSFVCAPFASKVPDHVQIILKPTEISSFLALDEEIMRDVSHSLASVIHWHTTERGVHDFNVVAYQTPLSVPFEESKYTLRFELMPRNRNVIAGIELGREVFVVDTLPESTAMALKSYVGNVRSDNWDMSRRIL